MTDCTSPESVEALIRKLEADNERPFPPGTNLRRSDAIATLRALSARLAEVEAELEQTRETNRDLHRRTQQAEKIEYRKAGRMARQRDRRKEQAGYAIRRMLQAQEVARYERARAAEAKHRLRGEHKRIANLATEAAESGGTLSLFAVKLHNMANMEAENPPEAAQEPSHE